MEFFWVGIVIIIAAVLVSLAAPRARSASQRRKPRTGTYWTHDGAGQGDGGDSSSGDASGGGDGGSGGDGGGGGGD